MLHETGFPSGVDFQKQVIQGEKHEKSGKNEGKYVKMHE